MTRVAIRLVPRAHHWSNLLLLMIVSGMPVLAEKNYDPGVSDTEIKIGNTAPYSGPVSAYGAIAKTQAAFFKRINEEGGINGRKINFISLDDAYSPPKTVEQVRRLIEQDEVFALFQNIGTGPNAAIKKYTNAKKVPTLFVSSVSEEIADPRSAPWTIPWNPSAMADGKAFAAWLLKAKPNAKIAVIYQNDDLGKGYLKGLQLGLGEKVKAIIAEASYEISDPTVDSQIIQLKGSGADTLFAAVTPKFAAQAIRKVYNMGWHPTFLVSYTGSAVETVLKPAGLEKSVGLITAYFLKTDAASWADDPGFRDYLAFMKKYYPEADPNDAVYSFGYATAWSFVELLKRCGNDVSRRNLIKHATNLRHVVNPMLLPGITLNTSPADYRPIEQLQMARFDGKRWVPFGPIIDAVIDH